MRYATQGVRRKSPAGKGVPTGDGIAVGGSVRPTVRVVTWRCQGSVGNFCYSGFIGGNGDMDNVNTGCILLTGHEHHWVNITTSFPKYSMTNVGVWNIYE